MSSVIPGRRRADEFAALVDGRSSADPLRHSDLLRLVADLRELPSAAPRPEFVASLRASLMAAADEALVPISTRLTLPVTTRSRRDRRVALAAGAVALVGATSSMAVAAQSALPGDALYPIKRVLESAETSMASDSARAEKVLDNATGRLDEVEALSLRDSAESQAALPNTLDDFVTQANQAGGLLLDEYADSGDVTHITELRTFISSSLDRLASLDAVLPAALRDELVSAVEALLTLDMRALSICPSCGSLLDLPAGLLPLVSASSSQTSIGQRPAIAAPPSVQTPPDTNAVGKIVDSLTKPTGSTDGSGDSGTDGSGDGDSGGTPSLPTDPVTDPVDELTGTLLETLTSGGDPLSTLLNGVVTTVIGPDGKLLK